MKRKTKKAKPAKPAAKPKPHIKAGTSKAAAAARKAAFVEAYIQNGGNGTQAAISAGYSARRARQTAAELVTNRDISAKIDERRRQATEKAQEKTELTVEGVLLELRRIVHADPRNFFDEAGNLRPIKDLDDDAIAALAGFEVTEEFAGRGEDRESIGYTKKVKFWDKNAAIEKAMKYFGLFEKDNRQRSPLEGFTNDDARELRAWLQANRPPVPAPDAGR